jgi:hypothetical protein
MNGNFLFPPKERFLIPARNKATEHRRIPHRKRNTHWATVAF